MTGLKWIRLSHKITFCSFLEYLHTNYIQNIKKLNKSIKMGKTKTIGTTLLRVKMKLKRPFLINKDRAKRLQVLSSGGGTQSNCMLVLIAMGALPKPDLVVMADTEREASNVFEYQKKYIAPLCKKIGLEYVIIPKSDWTTADILYTSKSNDETTLPGFFTEINGRDKNSECGKQASFCSDKWKKEVLHRYLNDRFGEKELTKRGVDFWIGMSFDEPKRIRYNSGKWQKRYPLFESMILREQAIKIVQDYGFNKPPRSICWMCPNRHYDVWQWMKENVPNDFKKAVEFEKQLQIDFPWLWLTKSGVPLESIDFVALSKSDKQIDIFDRYCDTGMCFV